MEWAKSTKVKCMRIQLHESKAEDKFNNQGGAEASWLGKN